MHLLKIFKKPTINTVVAYLGENSMYNMDWNAISSVNTEVKDSCLKLCFDVTASPVFDEIEPVSLSFEYSFLLPPHKVYNPAEVSKRLNNLSGIVVRDFRFNSKKSRLFELNLEQTVIVQQYCQRILKQYFLDNEVHYQHCLEALCYCKEFNLSQQINLKVCRYSQMNKEWRWFRYQRCNYLFNQNNKISSKAVNDEKFQNGFTDLKFGVPPVL